jgi:transposase InsO family protein
MARDGVPVGPELAAEVAAFAAGGPVNVTRRCAELGVSRTMFYKYVTRFRERGVQGFFPDSRRPRRSPTKLAPALEDVLVTLRKEEAQAGWDYGADAVLMRLEERPQLWPAGLALPSRATVNRVFDSRGQLDRVPQRRPRPTPRRFERGLVNELWQYDGFDCLLADHTLASVLHLSDDCSRTDVGLRAARSENGQDVWEAFCVAVAEYGLPGGVLTDNGSAFSTKHSGSTNKFEARLTALGIQTITSRVSHPQTCGKNERAHQRVRKFLARRPPAKNLDELQDQLDEYRHGYNNRRNLVLGKLTPHQRFALGPFAGPDQHRQIHTHLTRHIVSARGTVGVDKTLVGVGRAHATKTATVFRRGDHVTIFIDDKLARDLILDRRRHYQPQDR